MTATTEDQPPPHLVSQYVFLDTEAFHSLGFDWSGRALAKLRELAKTQRLRLLTTEITQREISAHINDLVEGALAAVRKHRATLTQMRLQGVAEMLAAPQVARDYAANAFQEYLAAFPPVHVPLAGSAADILADYFEQRPPFSDKKKTEFPDAFVIASLVAWCEANKKTAYVVSRDPDLKNACQRHPSLIQIDSVNDFISRAVVSEKIHNGLIGALQDSSQLADMLTDHIVGLKARTPTSSFHSTAHSLSASGRVRRARVQDIPHAAVFESKPPEFICEIECSVELDLDLEVDKLPDDDGRWPIFGDRTITTTQTFLAEIDVNYDPESGEIDVNSIYISDDIIDLDPRELSRALF